LHNPVAQGLYPQRALFAAGFWNVDATCWLWLIGAIQQFNTNFLQMLAEILLKRSPIYSVDTSGFSSRRRQRSERRLLEPATPCNQSQQPIEPAVRVCC
jgi:hypothetical protein|tara:strand:- start:743 stop:1039 length:297 start_codon:yes stop_codon:yes gene_type:complete